MARRAFDRLGFLCRAEHLAQSDAVPLSVSRTFETVHALCRRAWYERAQLPRWTHHSVRRDLRAQLRPLAGSARDWVFASGRIDALVQTTLHPDQLRRHFRPERPGQPDTLA